MNKNHQPSSKDNVIQPAHYVYFLTQPCLLQWRHKILLERLWKRMGSRGIFLWVHNSDDTWRCAVRKNRVKMGLGHQFTSCFTFGILHTTSSSVWSLGFIWLTSTARTCLGGHLSIAATYCKEMEFGYRAVIIHFNFLCWWNVWHNDHLSHWWPHLACLGMEGED